MFEILARENLTPDTALFKIKAPAASRAKPGQFVMVRVDEMGERIPLTAAEADPVNGVLSIVVQAIGYTTKKLHKLQAGDAIADLVGPLGVATEVENFGTVVCVAGGLGIAEIYPIAKALKEAGNRVISIIGARTQSLFFWEDRMREVSTELIVTTDDGSYGRTGVVTIPLKEVIEREKVDLALIVGPAIMMKFCAKTTEPYGVKTISSINSIMIDGTGMCGGCRISVGGETKFVCVDGPDFDAHKVDWDLLMARQKMYAEEEKEALALLLEEEKCDSCKEAAR